MIEDTDYCQGNVRKFAQAQLATMLPLEVEIRPGVILGHRHIPVNSVGSYIPGGRYPMFGSAQMSIIPAKVAGVKTVVACTPPVKGEGYYPATINAMKKAGADRIFIVGGVPALAMMAFGLGGVEPVDMLCGAGNRFVAEAKRQLFGRCGIDLLAGPTEIAIIADDSADPALVACDLLGQAEHDPNSGIYLICMSEEFARKTIAEVEKQLAVLPTREIAALSWRDNGIVTVADSPAEADRLERSTTPPSISSCTWKIPSTPSRTSPTTAPCSSAKRRPSPTATSRSAPTTSCPRAGPRATPAASGSASSSRRAPISG